MIEKRQAAGDVCRVVLLDAHGAGAHPDRLRFAQGAGDEDLGHHDVFVLHRVVLADPELAETKLLGPDDELQVLVIALGGGLGGVMERHDEHAGADRRCVPIQAHGSTPWLTGSGESCLDHTSSQIRTHARVVQSLKQGRSFAATAQTGSERSDNRPLAVLAARGSPETDCPCRLTPGWRLYSRQIRVQSARDWPTTFLARQKPLEQMQCMVDFLGSLDVLNQQNDGAHATGRVSPDAICLFKVDIGCGHHPYGPLGSAGIGLAFRDSPRTFLAIEPAAFSEPMEATVPETLPPAHGHFAQSPPRAIMEGVLP